MPLPRLFVGNFDFEHCLADPQRVLPRRLHELNADLAWSWLAMARDGDRIWMPRSSTTAALDVLRQMGTIRGSAGASSSRASVRFVTDWRDVETAVELVPWGWTDEMLHAARAKGWQFPAVDPAVVKWANSRRTSAQFEIFGSPGLPGAVICNSLDKVRQAIDVLPEPGRWVVKAEFGMSGRERQVGQGPLSPAAANWITRRLAADGVVFFEPWVDRLDEVGILFDIPTSGDPILVGVAPMLIAPGGHYRGSWFAFSHEREIWWSDATLAAKLAAKTIQRRGYIGPLGIDAMLYRQPNGTTAIRPLQDINARWTMGRLAWSWRERLPDATCGYWWHGPRTAFNAGEHLAAWPLPQAPQTLVTTPDDVNHVAVLVWQ